MKKYIIFLLFAVQFAAFSSFTNSDREILIISDLRANGIDFGDVPVGTTRTRSTLIINDGSANLMMISLKIKGADSAYFIYEKDIKFPRVIHPGEAIQISFKFSPTIAKSFQAEVEIDYGVPNSPCLFFITANSIVSVWEQTDFIYSIAPNPAQDYIEINLTDRGINPSVNENVKIYNLFGEIVVSSIATPPDPLLRGGKLRIDISGLSAGVYFIRSGNVLRSFIKI